MTKRFWSAAAVAAAVLLALIPVGRWEAHRHARHEMAGFRRVLAAIGPLDQSSLDAYRIGIGPGLDCLLYKRGANPYALEVCFQASGRVVETYDRRGSSPKIWSLREDPSSSSVFVDGRRAIALVQRLSSPRS